MMCLDIVYRGKQKKEALAKLPENGVYWKVCKEGKVNYLSEFSHGLPDRRASFSAGWNKTEPFYPKGSSGYKIAFHAFRCKRDAKLWAGSSFWLCLVRCKVKKEDIVAIGQQDYGFRKLLTIVTKRIWMPKPKKKPA